MPQQTYKPALEALGTLREISRFERGKVIGSAYRLRELLQWQLERMPPPLEGAYVALALRIWEETDGTHH